MRIFAPLRHRPIAKLWSGQLLSALGDEINRVTTTWLAARLWGADAGRLMAVYAACACVFSLVGGRFTDRATYRRVLVSADLARAAAVLAIPVGAAFGLPLGPLLVASVAVSASLTAVFEPALRALTVVLIPTIGERGETNALMESTVRFARVLGPTTIATLSAFIPALQLFTLDAFTFACSAVSILWIGAVAARLREPEDAAARAAGGFVATVRMISADPAMRYAVASSAVVGAAWWLLLPLGMELLLQARGAVDVSALAGVMLAYGVGNLASNLVVGNFANRNPERLLYLGRVLAGAGFLGFVLAPGRATLAAAAALAASGGPFADVGFIGMVQARYDGLGLVRVYRINLALAYATMFALFFVSPSLFKSLGVATVFLGSAVTIALGGILGFARARRAAGRRFPATLASR